MPGLMSVKTPEGAAPLQISIPDIPPAHTHSQNSNNNKNPSPHPPKRPPSPSPSSSTSRAKPSPDRGSSSNFKKKLPPFNISDDSSLDNPDLGPFLLKLARDTIASGDRPHKALDYALRAATSFERCTAAAAASEDKDKDLSLDLAMSLHVVSAIYCSLGRYEDAVPVLERAVKVPLVSRGPDHALAAFFRLDAARRHLLHAWSGGSVHCLLRKRSYDPDWGAG